jgi:CRP-like cAMP-binding protein
VVPSVATPHQNCLLAKLPTEQRSRLLEDASEVTHNLRDVVFEQGDTIQHVYFPLTGMISLLTVLNDGTSLESLPVGYEGMAGLSLFHGVQVHRFKGLCQIGGKFMRIPADAFLRFVQTSADMQRALHRYSEFVTDVIAQYAACNTVHSMDQRCARWLMLTRDAARSDTFLVTQESLAQMLAVRRPGVTNVMGRLQRKKLLTNSRGKVTIIDRVGLLGQCCECYQATVTLRECLIG